MNHHKQRRLQRTMSYDQTELTTIYDDYQPPIYRYIYRQIGEVETTRDLTALVFERLLEALQKGKGPNRELKAWLYRTAHNIVVDHYRRQHYRRHLPLDEAVIDIDDDPAELVETFISAESVRSALRHLTPDQRQVITLKFLGELSNQEVATVLNKPIGAVKSLQHRALAALQRQLIPTKEKVPS